MIDPKAGRRRAPESAGAPAELAEVHGLLLELAPLQGLAWAPLGERVELLTAAMLGGEGVSAGLVQQLRRWAHRWPEVHADLRAFYLRHAREAACEAALWKIFEGGDRLTGPLRGQLDRLWTEDHGALPDLVLVPHPRRSLS